MKVVKISLAFIVVAAIGAGIFLWIQSTKDPAKVKAPENQFTRKIEQEIELLKAKPDTKFCKDFYKEVEYYINDFHKQSRFGKNEIENNQWKENLESNLFFAYIEKFIKQVKTVFCSSEWQPNDIKFIQSEKNELKKSKFLLVGSPLDKEFTSIQTVLNKYNEIVSFILSCKGLVCSGTALSDHFPITDMKSKISRASSLLSSHLENEFANNCSRLHNDLKEIPQILFRAHVRYLDNKISNWSGMYSNYASQSDYANIFYKPLKAQVDELDNDIYNVSNFDSEYNRLIKKLDSDSQRAYNYFSNKH